MQQDAIRRVREMQERATRTVRGEEHSPPRRDNEQSASMSVPIDQQEVRRHRPSQETGAYRPLPERWEETLFAQDNQPRREEESPRREEERYSRREEERRPGREEVREDREKREERERGHTPSLRELPEIGIKSAQKGLNGLMDLLGMDGEQMMILIIIFLLFNENVDRTLLIALFYIMM